METLEFQFDEELICNEDLKEILQTTQAEPRQFEDVHPLRKLIINTMDSKLDLGFEDLIEMGVFLDNLFPRLEKVRGTDVECWTKVDVLIASYHSARERANL